MAYPRHSDRPPHEASVPNAPERPSPTIESGAVGYLAFVLGAISDVDDVELAAIEAAVGSTSLVSVCGRGYARGSRVLRIERNPDTNTLNGSDDAEQHRRRLLAGGWLDWLHSEAR